MPIEVVREKGSTNKGNEVAKQLGNEMRGNETTNGGLRRYLDPTRWGKQGSNEITK